VEIKEAGGRVIGLLLPVPVGIYRLLGSNHVLYRPVPVVACDRISRSSPVIMLITAEAGIVRRGRAVDGLRSVYADRRVP